MHCTIISVVKHFLSRHIAKEMGIHYASIAMVTDYDCWKENEEVNVENVMKQMKDRSINYRL